jgi:hypothetical protein
LEALDLAMDRLYRVISFDEASAPDWAGMADLFAPGARLTRVTPDGVDALDLPGFEAMLAQMIDSGAVRSFFEHETCRRVEMFGAVAHVLSSYETKRSAKARVPFGRGINSIQLRWDSDRWLIVSLLWDEGLPGSARRLQPLEVVYDVAA